MKEKIQDKPEGKAMSNTADQATEDESLCSSLHIIDAFDPGS